VRFAPLYDAVTTGVFPGLAGDRMALKLNGKDDRLTRQDFLTLARTIDLPAARAEASMSELAIRLGDAAPGIALPERLGDGAAKIAQDAIRNIVAGRVEAFR
jgi:serine/threonine-protein kinase HipA